MSKSALSLETEFYCLEAKTYIHKIAVSKEATLKEKRNRLFEISLFLNENLERIETTISEIEKLLNAEILERGK